MAYVRVTRLPFADKQAPKPDPIQARIIEDLEQVREEMRVVIARTEFFSGPLPPPRSLIQYNDAATDGGNRIVSDWEKQGEHERAMDRMEHEMQLFSLKKEASLAERGQWMGFIIAIAFLLVSAWLIVNGHPVAGGALGTVDLIGLVTVFVTQQRAASKSPNAESAEVAQTSGDNSDSSERHRVYIGR